MGSAGPACAGRLDVLGCESSSVGSGLKVSEEKARDVLVEVSSAIVLIITYVFADVCRHIQSHTQLTGRIATEPRLGGLDVRGEQAPWGRLAWWSRAAVEPAAGPHVRGGSALPLTMTPRGGLDRGGMGAGGRRRARSGWTRRMCAESRTGPGLRRGCTRHRRGQGHRRPHGATRRRHLH